MSRSIAEFLHPDDVQPTINEIAERRQNDGRQRFVNRYRTREGEYRWIEWRSVVGTDGYLYAGGRDITKQREIENELINQVYKNETLLKELQHRVKNSLAAVSSLIAMSDADHADEPSRQVLREAQGRVEAITKVYDTLYRSDLGIDVDLGRYVEDLAQVVTAANNPGNTAIELRIVTDSATSGIGEVFPVGLILNELLTNVLKYAYPDCPQGVVDVVFRRDGSAGDVSGILQVTDYGAGFPDGFDIDGSSGTGLMLIRSLVEQLDGTVQIESSHGNSVRVTFPLVSSRQSA